MVDENCNKTWQVLRDHVKKQTKPELYRVQIIRDLESEARWADPYTPRQEEEVLALS
jgi:hypothetical protein